MMNTWRFVRDSLHNNIDTILLYVVQSAGSSPGRNGFLMAINADGAFCGTIGGGIMEVKLIETAKSMLSKKITGGLLKRQYHDKAHKNNQSGMICSGEQIIILQALKNQHLRIIKQIIESDKSIFLSFSDSDFRQIENTVNHLEVYSPTQFSCHVVINPACKIHIFGAGHVGSALVQQLQLLSHKIILYDDRPNVILLHQNKDSYKIKLVEYRKLSANKNFKEGDIAVIASFGYRSDKVILKQIIEIPFSYVGMMGSDAKIQTIRKELMDEGYTDAQLNQIHMPIGINIYSKTPAEIAVSIAAQIIYERNKTLPTGRSY